MHCSSDTSLLGPFSHIAAGHFYFVCKLQLPCLYPKPLTMKSELMNASGRLNVTHQPLPIDMPCNAIHGTNC